MYNIYWWFIMVFKNKKGMFQLQRNFRDSFNEEAFIEKYIEECMDRYLYIVGDISSGILRLKGFDDNPKSKNYYGFIDDYLVDSCPLGCPYYVLKHIKNEQEYERLLKHPKNVDTSGLSITPIVKENYDKESLILNTTPKSKPNIVIDINKINAIPKGELADDLKEFIKLDKNNNTPSKQTEKQEGESSQTFVSSSPDFDPSKVNNKYRNKPNKGNNQNNNNRRNSYNSQNNVKNNNNDNKRFNKNKSNQKTNYSR